MKNALYLMMGICYLFSSCDNVNQKDDYPDLVKKTEINPAFENTPPIAKNIFLQELDKPEANGNNVKFIAEFEKGAIEGKFLAIMLNDEKVVLRDDGKGADEVEGDGRFSLNMTEDINELKAQLSQRQRTALSNRLSVIFRNRSLKAETNDRIREFNIDSFSKRRAIRIPIDILGGLLPLSDSKKTLMITNLGVVEDPTRTFNPCTQVGNPTGVWTFGALVRQMASPNPGSIATDLQVSDFVRKWLNTWTSNQTVNGEALPARTSIQSLITEWENKSAVAAGGVLNMKFAPFKLIAIVNRLDLRGNSGYGFKNGGEGRFVFNALLSNCNLMPFTVIFEYGINKKSCSSVKAFAQEWNNLNSLTLGSPAYNTALEQITNQFVLSGTDPSKPNQNSINQVRTNEIALNSPWELREFNLTTSGLLQLVTVKQEPAVKYNAKLANPDVERLAAFVNTNQANIEGNKYTIPDNIPVSSSSPTPTTEFLGGKSHTIFPPTGTPPNVHHWNGTTTAGPTFIISDSARHIFSLNTCSGCHGGETQTFFTHINPSNFGVEAGLSGFLNGNFVVDAANRPSGSPRTREFNDLLRRAQDLSSLISNVCIKRPFFELAHKLTFEPIRMTH